MTRIDDEYFQVELTACERLPKSEQESNRDEFWQECASIAPDRIDWLLCGHYGKGAYDAAWNAVNTFPKSLVHLYLLTVVAALDWDAPLTLRSCFEHAAHMPDAAHIDEIIGRAR